MRFQLLNQSPELLDHLLIADNVRAMLRELRPAFVQLTAYAVANGLLQGPGFGTPPNGLIGDMRQMCRLAKNGPEVPGGQDAKFLKT